MITFLSKNLVEEQKTSMDGIKNKARLSFETKKPVLESHFCYLLS